MPDVSAFDAVAGAIALVFVVYGAMRGMARLTLHVAGLVLGCVLAMRYSEWLAVKLGAAAAGATAGWDPLRLVSCVLIFLAVTVAASLVAWPVTRVLTAAHLGLLDRLAGAGAGLLMATLLICGAMIPLVALSPPDGGIATRDSVLAPYAVAGGDYLKAIAPEPMRSRFIDGARRFFSPPPARRTS